HSPPDLAGKFRPYVGRHQHAAVVLSPSVIVGANPAAPAWAPIAAVAVDGTNPNATATTAHTTSTPNPTSPSATATMCNSRRRTCGDNAGHGEKVESDQRGCRHHACEEASFTPDPSAHVRPPCSRCMV